MSQYSSTTAHNIGPRLMQQRMISSKNCDPAQQPAHHLSTCEMGLFGRKEDTFDDDFYQ